MARTIRNLKFDTRSARLKLPEQKSAYWVSVAQGCAIGYSKGPKGGAWLAKFVGDGHRKQVVLGPADDVLDADGVAALSFPQAQEKARAWFAQQARVTSGCVEPIGPYLVRNAVEDYLRDYQAGRTKGGGRSLDATKAVIDAFILPAFGDTDCAKLSTAKIRTWHDALAKSPARLRGGKHTTKRATRSHDPSDPEAVRRRRSTANRILTVLKAVLNHAWREGKIASDEGWRRVKPFHSVDAARVHYLSADETMRLVNAAAPDFRWLVQAALHTGARYSELTAMRVRDFDADTGMVLVPRSKSGKARHIVLTEAGAAFFSALAIGRAKDDRLFAKEDGTAWGRSHQTRPMAAACAAAGIRPALSFHGLRHTYASHAVMSGIPLLVLADNLGHGDTRMVEKHYGHLSQDYRTTMIRQNMPTLGETTAANNVVPLRHVGP